MWMTVLAVHDGRGGEVCVLTVHVSQSNLLYIDACIYFMYMYLDVQSIIMIIHC